MRCIALWDTWTWLGFVRLLPTRPVLGPDPRGYTGVGPPGVKYSVKPPRFSTPAGLAQNPLFWPVFRNTRVDSCIASRATRETLPFALSRDSGGDSPVAGWRRGDPQHWGRPSSTRMAPFLDVDAATEPNRSPSRQKHNIFPFPASDGGR
jgi:hypothetical protein